MVEIGIKWEMWTLHHLGAYSEALGARNREFGGDFLCFSNKIGGFSYFLGGFPLWDLGSPIQTLCGNRNYKVVIRKYMGLMGKSTKIQVNALIMGKCAKLYLFSLILPLEWVK